MSIKTELSYSQNYNIFICYLTMWIDCVSLNEYDFIAHRSSLALCYWDVTDSVKVQKFDQGHWSFNFLLTLSSWREPNKLSLLFVRPKVILNQAVTGSDISFLRRYTFFQIFLNFSKIKKYIYIYQNNAVQWTATSS